jgi:hypothetical protein
MPIVKLISKYQSSCYYYFLFKKKNGKILGNNSKIDYDWTLGIT